MNLPTFPQLPKNFPLSQKQLVIVGGAIVLGIIIIALIFLNLRLGPKAGDPVTLNVWGTLDETEALTGIFDGYIASWPNVTIEYRHIDAERYEDVLLNALAAGEGPDVFMVHNHWIPKHMSKLASIAPSGLTQVGATRLNDLFPEVVQEDFTDSEGNIYALPIHLDSLALFYNKGMFNTAGVVYPPKDWTEFQATVPKLRILKENGQIVRAGAAMGGSEKSIDVATDIVSLLMLQNGVNMTNSDLTSANFAQSGTAGTGAEAFSFYTQFGDTKSPYYTWTDNQGDAVQNFAEGKAGMIFNYHGRITDIKNRAPFLNFAVAPMPQLTGSEYATNYADYWGFAVSKQSAVSEWGLDFILSAMTNAASMKTFSESDGYPPALRSLIKEKMDDADMGVFARQALTATSWYQIDETEIKDIFSRGISRVLSGQITPEAAISEIEGQVSELMNSRSDRRGF